MSINVCYFGYRWKLYDYGVFVFFDSGTALDFCIRMCMWWSICFFGFLSCLIWAINFNWCVVVFWGLGEFFVCVILYGNCGFNFGLLMWVVFFVVFCFSFWFFSFCLMRFYCEICCNFLFIGGGFMFLFYGCWGCFFNAGFGCYLFGSVCVVVSCCFWLSGCVYIMGININMGGLLRDRG